MSSLEETCLAAWTSSAAYVSCPLWSEDVKLDSYAEPSDTSIEVAMIRIRFPTDQDRVQGNYLLTTQSVVRRLRGQIFEVSEAGLKFLGDHHITYQTLVIPGPSASDQEVRNPLTVHL
jgi:hypothetical protein